MCRKIREIEALFGMTRANIRFYKAEGLLNPAREENGYRDYSEEDLEILKKSVCSGRCSFHWLRLRHSRVGMSR
ncbi:MAG: MerR family transcriptional regulator [Lachnospiraceae bacterium]|nr:MerR family transcriptional regulator [Lachnospiraceae bacterium]